MLLHTVTMDAEQGVDFLRRSRPRRAIPVHYDDYRVFRSPLSALLHRAADADLTTHPLPVERGQTVTL